MEPYINMIGNFDAREDYKVTYTYLGAQRIITNELSIRESTPNSKPVYVRQSTKFDKDHNVPAKVLTNGKSYLAKIRVQLNNEWSEWSAEMPFTCLSKPSIIFQSLDEKNYVYNDDIMMTALYRQEQGEKINTFQFTLMDSNKSPITKYPVRHPDESSPNILRERINGLVKGRLYYIGCRVTTVNGINYLQTHEFIPHYVAPSLDGIMQVKNQPESGQVLVQSYLKQLLGTQTKPFIPNAPNDDPGNYTFLNNEWVIVPPEMPLVYTRLGMAKASDWLAKIWCKNVTNGVMLDFSKQFGEGVHVRFVKHDDYITVEKEYNGLVSRTKSNVIKGLGLKSFYMFIKVIEFRVQVTIVPSDKVEILHDFSITTLGYKSKIKKFTGRNEASPTEAIQMTSSEIDGIKYPGDNKHTNVSATELNGRAQLIIEYDILEILEKQLGDSIWGGKTEVSDRVLKAKNIIETIEPKAIARGSSTLNNKIAMRVYKSDKWANEIIKQNTGFSEMTPGALSDLSLIDKDGKFSVGFIVDHLTSDGVSELSLDYASLKIKVNTAKI